MFVVEIMRWDWDDAPQSMEHTVILSTSPAFVTSLLRVSTVKKSFRIQKIIHNKNQLSTPSWCHYDVKCVRDELVLKSRKTVNSLYFLVYSIILSFLVCFSCKKYFQRFFKFTHCLYSQLQQIYSKTSQNGERRPDAA